MKKIYLLLTLAFIAAASSIQGQNSTETKDYVALQSVQKTYTTAPIEGEAPVIDAVLDDPAWDRVEWGTDFIQYMPFEGQAPTQETAFKVLYDNKNLYVAFRCYDSEPDKVARRMSRRDGFEGDLVEINIDSYDDDRSAFSFTVSASGVKGDEFVSNNGDEWDPSWNPIWFLKTAIDSLGWVAEVRIPLSQIRYGKGEELSWGMQFTRVDFRGASRSVWQFLPLNSPNWVSSFGELQGLKGIKPQKQIEIQPYVLGQIERSPKEEGNPFATGTDTDLDIGLDGKFGVTGDMVLDFTINPDFGQVEADPSALTLDGFQIFFEERRPFFVENRNLFNYQFSPTVGLGGGGQDNLFYSRRIGGAPHGYPDLPDGAYAEVPGNTSILGALKFSGKTKKGLGIGILEAVTSREIAQIAIGSDRAEEVVEPLSNYFVGRLSQDFKQGQTVIGGILTSVQREKENADLLGLHRQAYSTGLDLVHWWKDRTYYLSASLVGSQVQGSAATILNTQTSFEHLFQRPDAQHVEVDSNATSMSGYGGSLRVGKSNGHFIFDTGINWRSPELEFNDLGFMRNADEVNYNHWMAYRITEPFAAFRNMQFAYNHSARWDFGGNNLYQSAGIDWEFMLMSFWGLAAGVGYENRDFSNNDLRGGPTLRKSRGFFTYCSLFSDRRKNLFGSLNAIYAGGFEKTEPRAVRFYDFSMELTFQPINALNISIEPAFSNQKRQVQYIDERDFQGQARYLAGFVDQQTFYTTLRLNYNLTPNLTVQYYGQPFISRGRYDKLKYITDSKSPDFYQRFHLYTPEELSFSEGSYEFDENGDGLIDYTLEEPDFSFIQFRSNLVLRWEYVPGSEVFLVWAQSNTLSGDPTERLLPSLNDNLFGSKPNNIFLVKYTYRFLR